MYVSIRDLASLATLSLFMTALMTWGEILKALA